MTKNLSTVIQHHPSRAHLLPELTARLEGLDPVVITDPGGRQKSSWRTYRLCLESIPDDATHALIVQDDSWPCDQFAQHVHAAIEERPSSVIALFVSGAGHLMRRVNIARKQRERWLIFPQTSYIPLVATIFPAEVARRIPAFADSRRIPVARADDAVVGTFCRANRIACVATMPSLVEHLDSEPSVTGMAFGNGHPHRLAAWYVQSPVCVTEQAVLAFP